MADDTRRLEELLSGLVDGELAPDERREALSLIERDPEARALYERMEAMARAMRDESPPAPPEGLAERIAIRIRESGGELVTPPRRRWLGPAALTAAASVAAALVIGALLHDHWEVFAPGLEVADEAASAESGRQVTPAEAQEPAADEASASEALPKREAGKDEEGPLASLGYGGGAEKGLERAEAPAPPAVAQESEAVSTPIDGGPETLETADADVSARARDEPREQRADLLTGQAQEESRSQEYEARRPEKKRAYSADEERAVAAPEPAASAACPRMWHSSTRILPRAEAPGDAAERLDALVESLGGRRVGAPTPGLVVPAARLAELAAGLDATGHVFEGPPPKVPRDFDCVTLRLGDAPAPADTER